MFPLINPVTGGLVLGARSYSCSPMLEVAPAALDGHLVVVGDTGSGKTTLLRRLGLACALRPEDGLVVVLDCKGGPRARRDGEDWITDLVDLGADPSKIGLWPYQAPLNLWQMEAEDLIESLYGMIEPSHTHFDTLRMTALRMAVLGGVPPVSAENLLRRMTKRWMEDAWPEGSPFHGQVAYLTRDAGHVPAPIWDVQAKYANLFSELGGMFENGRSLDDFDVLWCAVPGTRRAEVAKASANAIVQLVVDALAKDKATGRPITLIIDEFSAVSAGVELAPIVERLRSLGGRVVVAAQSWEGLGPNDGSRSRLVAACSGGLMLMRTTHPAPFGRFIGSETVYEADERETVNAEGLVSESSGLRRVDRPVVEPITIRRQGVGHLVYWRGGHAVHGVVEPYPPLEPEVVLRKPFGFNVRRRLGFQSMLDYEYERSAI